MPICRLKFSPTTASNGSRKTWFSWPAATPGRCAARSRCSRTNSGPTTGKKRTAAPTSGAWMPSARSGSRPGKRPPSAKRRFFRWTRGFLCCLAARSAWSPPPTKSPPSSRSSTGKRNGWPWPVAMPSPRAERRSSGPMFWPLISASTRMARTSFTASMPSAGSASLPTRISRLRTAASITSKAVSRR